MLLSYQLHHDDQQRLLALEQERLQRVQAAHDAEAVRCDQPAAEHTPVGSSQAAALRERVRLMVAERAQRTERFLKARCAALQRWMDALAPSA